MATKRIAPGEKVAVELTPQEWTDLTEKTFVEREYVRFAAMDGQARRVTWSLEDIEEIQGHVAATANHTRSKALGRRLDALFDRLQQILDEHEETVGG